MNHRYIQQKVQTPQNIKEKKNTEYNFIYMKFKNKQNRNKICRDVGICSNSSRKARDYQKNQNNRYIMGGRRQ